MSEYNVSRHLPVSEYGYAPFVTLTIRNNHTGVTFTERLRSDRVPDRLRWYRDRGRTYTVS